MMNTLLCCMAMPLYNQYIIVIMITQKGVASMCRISGFFQFTAYYAISAQNPISIMKSYLVTHFATA